jgi:exodeoxyribonuclease V alpha subunit
MATGGQQKLMPTAGDEVDALFSIERVSFANEDTGFAVVQLLPADQPGRGPLTAVGLFGHPRVGECYRVRGIWQQDARFGMQIKVQSSTPEAPRSLEAIERYLAGASIKGLGPHHAGLLVSRFGEQTLQELQNGGPHLEEVSGIGPVRAAQIRKSWAASEGLHDLMVSLQGVAGMSPGQAQRVYQAYGTQAWQTVQTNPYRLAQDVRGFGFLRCDRIGQLLGLAADAPQRIQAALLHVLRQELQDGHLWSERGQLLAAAAELLGVDETLVAAQADALVAAHELVAETLEDLPEAPASIWLPEVGRVEERIADRLTWFLGAPNDSRLKLDRAEGQALLRAQGESNLTAEQSEALVWLLGGARLVVLTGGPGTGKTTTIRSLIASLERLHVSYALCATTGRAAKQLASSTGRKAATVHRHLGIGQRNREQEPVAEEVLVIDESSMIDIWLLDEIVQRLQPRTHLILVGDVDQLPSVGPGAVLQDLIAAADRGRLANLRVARLTRIFRQEAGDASLIVTNCHRVRRGETPVQPESKQSDYFEMHRDTPEEAGELAVELTARRLPSYLQIAPNEVQVLSPMHRGAAGILALNLALQQALNPPMPSRQELVQRATGNGGQSQRILREGDKVRQTQNDYQKQVFNGDLGIIRRIYKAERTVVVSFDERDVAYGYDELDQLVHAWAMTVHAAQGSQWPAVVVLMLTSHYVMLERNILYTALSRAQRLAVLVTQEKAVRIAVGRHQAVQRRTYLVSRLERAAGLPA